MTKNIKKLVRIIDKEKSVLPCVDGDWMDVGSQHLVILGSSHTTGSAGQQFHLDLLLKEAFSKLMKHTDQKGTKRFESFRYFYDGLFEDDFLSLLLFRVDCHIWLAEKTNQKKHLKRLLEIWNIVHKEEIRVSFSDWNDTPVFGGPILWEQGGILKPLLSQNGVPEQALPVSLPNADLEGLYKKYHVLE